MRRNFNDINVTDRYIMLSHFHYIGFSSGFMILSEVTKSRLVGVVFNVGIDHRR